HAPLALHCLAQQGFETYFPRLRAHRIARGRKIETQPALFPGYVFILIEQRWYSIRGTPGIVRLVQDGEQSQVPDSVIAEIRSRERNGLIELPKVPDMRPGDRIRILHGPLAGQLAIYAGMKPRERVEVLLTFLGTQMRAELARSAIEAVYAR